MLAVAQVEAVFGVRSGGLVALEAARTLPGIRTVAVYEPALRVRAADDARWLACFDREIADGEVAAALVTSMVGLELAPPAMRTMPRRLLVALTALTMRKEEKTASPDAITMRALAPTVRHEGDLVAELAGHAEAFRTVTADVLLLGGSKGLAFTDPARDELARVLPRVRRVEFPGFDHGASSDSSTTNRGSNPQTVAAVARELRSFLVAAAGPSST
ncbi:MAG TPA: hypothetical protein VMV41_12640 [Cellulomonadaceae bacterium]|nr:hypothetical protein [Cellulomonadaceae bacterium]